MKVRNVVPTRTNFETMCMELFRIDKHLSGEYISWLREDRRESRATEFTTHHRVTQESVREWVINTGQSGESLMFAILMNEVHVGNIRLYHGDLREDSYYLGVLVGQEWRGQGIGTRAIAHLSDSALRSRFADCLAARIYCDNHSSYVAFTRAGFTTTSVGVWNDHGLDRAFYNLERRH